jgi:DNA-binding beta-propeller fold protein YncE
MNRTVFSQIIRSLLTASAFSGLVCAKASDAPARFYVPQTGSGAPAHYHLAQTFKIGGMGNWDYVTVDSEHHLLFVPRSTHTMVIDAATGATVADIPGQTRNHGVALVPAVGRGFISDGDDASVVVFDLKTYAVLGKIKTERDSDGIIYDPASNKVLVVSGDNGDVIPISPDVDAVNGTADARIELGGKPEFLAADGQGKVFINLVDRNQVVVVDAKMRKVLARWSTAPGGKPVGLSLDRKHHRLLIGCRDPQKLVVLSTENGMLLANEPIGAGVDATQYDEGLGFASCADGTLTVIRSPARGRFAVLQSFPTKLGARTMGLDTSTHILYLPTADFEPAVVKGRLTPKPGTFVILVFKP